MCAQRSSGLTRWFLYLLIASIGIGALLAIVIVLAGNWGWTEGRILLTTGVVALASVFGMACGAAMSRGVAWWLPSIGIGLAILGGAVLIAGMWLEISNVTYWRYAAAVSILAVSSAHTALLSIARLQPSHGWIQLAASGLIFVFAVILIGLIFSESGSDTVVRILAVVGILDAAFTLLVPVFHFLDRRALAFEPGMMPEAASLASVEAEIERLTARLAELELQRAALGAAVGGE